MLTSDEASAILFALREETNPGHLISFAATLAPEHAVPAGLLWARAQLIERRREMPRALLEQALGELVAVGEGRAALPTPPDLPTLTAAVYLLAGPLRRDPRFLFGDVLKAAGDLAVDDSAGLRELPVPIAQLARALVVELVPGVRFVHPAAASLPTSAMFTLPSQREDRARWVRQFTRQALISSPSPR